MHLLSCSGEYIGRRVTLQARLSYFALTGSSSRARDLLKLLHSEGLLDHNNFTTLAGITDAVDKHLPNAVWSNTLNCISFCCSVRTTMQFVIV